MKHLSTIFSEFSKIAIESDWWKKLKPDQQKLYLQQHRKTKLRPGPATSAQRLLGQLPKRWKETIMYNGLGANSPVESIGVAEKTIRQAFDDNAIAVIGKSGGKVAFMIRQDGFTPGKYRLSIIDPSILKSSVDKRDDSSGDIFETERKWRRGHSYDSRKYDFRLRPLLDKINFLSVGDVLMVKHDEERSKLKQQRSESQSGVAEDLAKKKMLNETIKPVYDFYKAKIEDALETLRNASVPSMEDVMADRFATENMSKAMQSIKDNVSKIQSIRYDLPYEIKYQSYRSDPLRSMKDRRGESKEFLNSMKKIKDRFSEVYNEINREKIDDISHDLYSLKNEESGMQAEKIKQDILDDFDDIGFKNDEIRKLINELQSPQKLNIVEIIQKIRDDVLHKQEVNA